MKAARWHGQRDVRVDEVEPREPKPNEVRIRVNYAGICATDLHEYTNGPQLISTTPHPMTGRCAPLTMGHEFTGTVVDVGRDVMHLKKGHRVVAEATLPCGQCVYCKREQFVLCRQAAYLGFAWDGVFAEYCTIPASICHKVPDTLDSMDAVLTEPLATGMHAVRRGRVQIGESVAVIGAGTIGLCSLLSALAAGASRVFVVDPIAQKRTLAIELGADEAFDPTDGDVAERILEATNGVGVDVAFECVGSTNTVETATRSTRVQGRTVVVGLTTEPRPFSFLDIMVNEREVMGTVGYYGEFPMVLTLLAKGRINALPLVSKRISLDDIVSHGFEAFASPQNENIKIVVKPG